MIPVGARVGVGALVIALGAVSAGVPALDLAAITAAASASAAALRTAGSPRGRRFARGSGAVLAGAWLVIARLLLAGDTLAPAPSALPAGAGPWTGLVTATGTPKDGSQRLTVELNATSDPGSVPTGTTPASAPAGPSEAAHVPGPLLAVTAPRYPTVEPGDRVRLSGRTEPPPEGGYGDYLRRIGVAGTLRTPTLELMGRDPGVGASLERIRRAAGDALARALPEPAAGLAAGILVGLRDRVDRDLAAAFTATGLSHVVAISGWNIALVAGLVGALLAGRARRTRSGGIVLAIVLYTLLAGASPSVVRAAAMAGIALLARETGRPGTAAAALGWAVAVLVVAAPANAGDVGLQLSAAATAGLIAWSAPITAALDQRTGRLPGWVREGLGVSLAAQAATLPIVLLSFGRVAPLSPLLNLAVVPLVPAAMAVGALALVGGGVAALGGPAIVATLAGVPGAMVLGLLIAIVRFAATLPLANVTLDPPAGAIGAGLLVGAYVIGRLAHRARMGRSAIAGAARGTAASPAGVPRPPTPAPTQRSPAHKPVADGRRRGSRRATLLRGGAIVAALAVAVLVLAAAARPDGRVHIVVLDVGQGDAILVTGPTGGRMLVDGGPDPDRLLVALDARIPPWDRRIDLLVLTHPHEDHVAGLPLVLERYRVGRVAEPGMPGGGPGYAAFEERIRSGGPPGFRLATGDEFALDGVAFSVLWPDAERVPAASSDDGSIVNDSSIVLLGAFEGRRFLLAGDAEADVEQILVGRGLPAVDLLKVGHHGSRTSTSAGLVAATRPRVAAISVGAHNDYGHPSREVLDRLTGIGAAVLRTDLVGTIDVALGVRGIEVHASRRAPSRGADATTVARWTGTIGSGRTRSAGFAPAAVAHSPWTDRGAPASLPYHRPDDVSVPGGRRRPPPRARSARLAAPPRVRRRRGRRLARGPLRRTGRTGRCPPCRGGRAPPRRG